MAVGTLEQLAQQAGVQLQGGSPSSKKSQAPTRKKISFEEAAKLAGVELDVQPQQTKKRGVLGKIVDTVLPGVRGFGETLGTAAATQMLKRQEEQETQQDVALLDQVQERLRDPNVSTEQKKRLAGIAQNLGQSTIGNVEAVQKTGREIAGEAIGTGASTVGFGRLPGITRSAFSNPIARGAQVAAQEGALFGGVTELGRGLEQKQNLGDIAKRTVGGVLGGGAIGGTFGATASGIGEVTRRIKQKGITDAQEALREAARIKPTQITDDMTPAQMRKIAEEQAVPLNIQERLIGLDQASKKGLQRAGAEKVAEYVDLTQAGKLDPSVPPPFELAARNVENARNKIVDVLSDTGSDIGRFRNKVATIKAPQESVDKVVNTFDDQLKRLNLRVNKTGDIVQDSAKATKTTTAERNILQELRENLRRLKQSPTVENIIDNRAVFDSRIKFGKRANEVSNIVDPLSRKIRSELAEINRNVVGNEQSKILEKYSKIADLLNELNSYVDRRAGAEFLLRRVLSDRGGEAREILRLIQELTGIDLLGDAVAARVVTDIFGSPFQKERLAQQMTQAGMDVASFMRGDLVGGVLGIGKRAIEQGIDPEKVIKRAANQ